MGIKGRIHSIESFGTLDGPGVRYVLFLQGCSLRCIYCHNPDTWDCSAGELVDSEDIFKDILSYKNFIKTGGVTISGGEPLLQPHFVKDILDRCFNEGIHTAIDTSGSVPLVTSSAVIDSASLILLDIKSMEEKQAIELTGTDNKLTFKTLEYCEKIKKPVWIRHVLLPDYTLNMSLLEQLADYVLNFSCVELVELLPFHKMGEFKWRELNIPYKLKDTPEPSAKELKNVKSIFEKRNIKIILKN